MYISRSRYSNRRRGANAKQYAYRRGNLTHAISA
jgi:hypothetical protein